MRYYIWTEGCQMNIADSERMGSGLEQLGLTPADSPKHADVIVLNTCVVRQSAEDKAVGMLTSLKPWRQAAPASPNGEDSSPAGNDPTASSNGQRILAVMGCMVGPQQDALKKRFPYVDTFMQPQQFEPLITLLGDKLGVDPDGCIPMLDYAEEADGPDRVIPLSVRPEREAVEGPLANPGPVAANGSSPQVLPLEKGELEGVPRAQRTTRLLVPTHPTISTHVPIIHGCDKFCTFCIIPYRRGRETSRPIDELVHECQMLVRRGVREVTLLGQNVDSYGHDLPGAPDLADLLEAVHDRVPELARIRFLTSHPNDMSQRIIDTVARLPRVMEYINLPFQAGNDRVLERMRRGYTNAQYRELVGRIRQSIPGVAIVTDLIVGFPGETADEFEDTLAMVRDMRFDKVHVAAYSTRPNTIAQRQMEDDVPADEKQRRLHAIESLQEAILTDINATYLDTVQEVLVLGHRNGKLQGRTRTDKLVHFDPPTEPFVLSAEQSKDSVIPAEAGTQTPFALSAEQSKGPMGSLVNVRITKTSPWSLQGRVVPAAVPA